MSVECIRLMISINHRYENKYIHFIGALVRFYEEDQISYTPLATAKAHIFSNQNIYFLLKLQIFTNSHCITKKIVDLVTLKTIIRPPFSFQKQYLMQYCI